VIGSGGIKPCVSANVGDQFGSKNAHLLSKVFGWFYFSINAGSLLSMAITPILLQKFGLHWGPRVAFGVPGVFMLAATIIFWLGRFKFVHVPPNGIASFRETFSIANLKIIRNLLWIFLPIPIFWSLFDQSSSAWIFQASRMDLHFLGMELLPAQTHIFNPLLVLIFIPIFNYGLYPALNKLFRLTPLRKIGIGMFITAVSFLMAALIEHWIVDLKETPSIWWQVLSYGFLTTSEVMVSITCLEFSYTQAPKKLKSLIMATYYLSVTAGNLFTSLVNFYINDPVTGQNKLGPVEYYIFFAAAMVCANILFVVIAARYKETPQNEALNA